MKKGKLITVATVLAMTASIAAGLCACGKDDKSKDTHTHAYGAATYEWKEAQGGWTCTATKKCTDNDDTVTETVTAVVTATTATHLTAGDTTYTATFTKDGFTAQNKEVSAEKLPHTWGEAVYFWNTTDSGYTYTCKGTVKCDKEDCAEEEDATFEESATVSVKYELSGDEDQTSGFACGSSVWHFFTATFTDSRFTEQKQSEIKTWRHTYGDWFISKAPTMTETGEISHACTNCDSVEKDAETQLPVLSDSFWTKKDAECVTTPTLNSIAYDVYECEYGKVQYKTADKVEAPYDNKEYYQLEYSFNDADKLNKTINAYARHSVYGGYVLKFTDNVATGTMAPFLNKEVVILSKDAIEFNGKIDIVVNTKKADGTITDTVTYAGVCDEDTGVIAFIDNVHSMIILTPYSIEKVFVEEDPENEVEEIKGQIPDRDSVKASLFADYAIAVTHTCGTDGTVTIFYYDDAIHMGVSLKDAKADGSSVAAEDAYAAETLYVFDKDGEIIVGFAKKDGVLTETDGHEGNYSGVVLDGIGGATYNGDTYAYTWVGGEEILFTMINAEETMYFEVAPENAGAYAITQPKVTLTIHTPENKPAHNGGEKITIYEVYKNTKATLPTLTTTDNSAFIGWYLDDEFETPAADHIFTEDTAVYLRWGKAITVVLNYGDGTTATISTGESITIAELLTMDDTAKEWGFEPNDIDGKYFIGWYLEDTFTTSISTSTGIAAEEEGQTIQLYAKWVDLPAYYGSYKLWDTYSTDNFFTSGMKEFSIDEHGAITGNITGTVVSYDEATSKITWSSGSNQYVLFYDKVSGMMVGNYSSLNSATVDPNEFYFGVKGVTEKTDYVQYGIYGASTVTRFMRFLEYKEYKALLYKDPSDGAVYFVPGVAFTDAMGNALSVAEIRNSKTVVVKDAATGAFITARMSTAATFGTSGTVTFALDAYFGTYTLAENNDLLIGGDGTFTWGDKSGTYTEKAENVLAAYVVENGENVEYYEFTVNVSAKTYTWAKPTVHVVFESAYSTEAAVDVNLNIAYALPVPTHETQLFRYWTIEGTAIELDEDGKWVPTGTGTVTMTAVWLLHKTVTVHYNDGTTENVTINCGEGETVQLATPAYKKHMFAGWFTTPGFEANTEWTSEETVVNSDIDLYAKWVEAPYIDDFKGFYITNGNINSTASNTSYISNVNSGNIVIELTGISAVMKSDKLPFSDCTSSGTYTVEVDIDMVAHTIVFHVTKSGTEYIYHGVFDPVTGIIIANYTKDTTDFSGGVAFLLPSGYTKGSGNYTSTWANQSVVFDYVDGEGTVHTIYVRRGEAQRIDFDAVISAEDGTRLAMNGVAKADYVKISASSAPDAEIVFEGGYNGTTLVAFDKYKETYTDSGEYGSVIINGVGGITINGKKDKYVEISDNVLGATVDGVYYEITVDVATKTCTVTAPKGNITFTFDHATLGFNQVEVNSGVAVAQGIKVEFTLPIPAPATGYQFIGWFTEQDYSGTAITKYTLENATDNVILYAKIETVPTWASKDTAEELVFTEGAATISGETSKLNSTYWVKITVTETTVYTFNAPDYPVKTSGSETSKYYGRFAVVAADGTGVGSAMQFANSGDVAVLDAGTYYVQVNLGGKVLTETTEKDYYGTFTISVTSSVASSYTLGESVTTTGGGYVYTVELTAGTTYHLNWQRTSQPNFYPMAIYSNATLTTAAVPTNGTGTAAWANTKDLDFTVSTTGTYYILVREVLTFSIAAQA